MSDLHGRIESYLESGIGILDAIAEIPTEDLAKRLDKALDSLKPILVSTIGRFSIAIREDIVERAALVAKIREEHKLSEGAALKLVLDSYAQLGRALGSSRETGSSE